MNLREWALPVYTVLTQMATGALFTLWLVRAVNAPRIGTLEVERIVMRPVAAIWLTILVAVLGAHLHLSMPLLSFLALANLGSSWLSREILFTVLLFLSISSLAVLEWFVPGYLCLRAPLGWFAIVSGAAGIFCMGAIYLLPTQPAWNTPLTVASFYATALLLGMMEIAVLLVMDLKFSELREPDGCGPRREVIRRTLPWLAVGATAMSFVAVFLNFAQICRLESGGGLARLSLDLLLGLYLPLFILRMGLPLAGGGLLLLAVATLRRTKRAVSDLMMPTYISCLFVLVGEILGRFLFYATHIRLGI